MQAWLQGFGSLPSAGLFCLPSDVSRECATSGDKCVQCDIEECFLLLLSNDGKASALSVVVDVFIDGEKARALIDTGASCSFCTEIAVKHKTATQPIPPPGFRVRLGNGGSHAITQRILNAEVTMNRSSSVQDVMLIPHPSGIAL